MSVNCITAMQPTDSLAYKEKVSQQTGYYKNRTQIQNIIQQKPEYRTYSFQSVKWLATLDWSSILDTPRNLCQDIHTKARTHPAYPVGTGTLFVFGHKAAGSWSQPSTVFNRCAVASRMTVWGAAVFFIFRGKEKVTANLIFGVG
jgi:hypothetical protein